MAATALNVHRLLIVLTAVLTTSESLPLSESTSASESEDHCAELHRDFAERFVFDVIRKKCVSTQAPDCPPNMELRSFPGNDTFVLCDCVSHYPAVYNCSTDSCDLLYKQEYCAPGQWLIPDPKYQEKVNCASNVCNPSTTTSINEPQLTEYTWFKGECGAIGFHHPDCDKNETLAYNSGELEAQCVPSSVFGGGSDNRGFAIAEFIPNLQCSKGTKWSQLTHNCQTPRHFNLS